jgi:hypothetical protein
VLELDELLLLELDELLLDELLLDELLELEELLLELDELLLPLPALSSPPQATKSAAIRGVKTATTAVFLICLARTSFRITIRSRCLI